MTLTLLTLLVVIVTASLIIHKNTHREIDRVTVKAYALPEPSPTPPVKEKKPVRKETLGVSVNPIKLIRILLSDPHTREMVYTALRAGPMKHTEVIGSANLATDQNAQEWYTVFAGTRRERSPGEKGFVHCTRRGDRVHLRLRRQEVKSHDAVRNPQLNPAVAQDSVMINHKLLKEDALAVAALKQISGPTKALKELFPEKKKETGAVKTSEDFSLKDLII